MLKYLDDDLLGVSGQKRLEGSIVEIVARNLLQALVTFYENGFVHIGNMAS